MSVDVVTDTVINRPIGEVADYAIDPGNAPEWYANITRVQWETPAPLAVGSRLAFEARFLGRTLAYTYEIVELSPGQAPGDAHRPGAVPHGDDLHLGPGRGRTRPG